MAMDSGTQVNYKGEDSISVYESSEWAQRGFCKTCGSSLYYKLKANGQYFIPVFLFDLDFESVKLKTELFIEEKPSFYEFANETHKLTGEELFAQFSS